MTHKNGYVRCNLMIYTIHVYAIVMGSMIKELEIVDLMAKLNIFLKVWQFWWGYVYIPYVCIYNNM